MPTRRAPVPPLRQTAKHETKRARPKEVKPASASVPWQLVEHARNVHAIRFDSIREGWEAWALLQSDEHFDNPHCDRTLYRRHLEQARQRRAAIIKYGDLFCAMQGKWDKRGNKDSIRQEDSTGNYLDQIVKHAAEFHVPYADLMTVVGPGNHETSILKRHETHLTERFVEQLRTLCPSSPVRTGGFTGWIRFQFTIGKSKQTSLRLWYHHGYGGGGPVTRGIIQTNRRAVYVDADILATGHTHDAWIMPIERIQLSDMNVQRQVKQLHVCTPGYKNEYADGFGGWHIERGGPPKPLGGVWLRFWLYNDQIHYEATLAE